jgi:hypothetical protein
MAGSASEMTARRRGIADSHPCGFRRGKDAGENAPEDMMGMPRARGRPSSPEDFRQRRFLLLHLVSRLLR